MPATLNDTPFILVVEDEMVLQDVYKMVLNAQNYRVSVASNGIEALKVLRSSVPAPDLILLDIFMPQMDGREFLRNLDASEYPDTKIIVNSNIGDKDTIDELLALGAHGYALKASMSPNELVQLVENNLA